MISMRGDDADIICKGGQDCGGVCWWDVSCVEYGNDRTQEIKKKDFFKNFVDKG